jgi:hypothetical protein
MSTAGHAMETMPLRRLVGAYAAETRCEFMRMLQPSSALGAPLRWSGIGD